MFPEIILTICVGFFGVITQVTLLQILQQVFYGNELSYGIILALWLLFTGLGAHIASALGTRHPHTTHLTFLSGLTTLAAIAAPGIAFGAFFIRGITHYLPGELVSLSFIITTATFAILTNAFVQGMLFSTLCHIRRSKHRLAQAINITYLWEAAGACIGGLIHTCFLSPHLPRILTILLTAVVLMVTTLVYLVKHRAFRRMLLPGITLLILAWCIQHNTLVETTVTHAFYAPLTVTDSIHTRYGQTTLTQQDEETITLFENGTRAEETHNDYDAEQRIVLALANCSTPNPRTLVLGSGILSTIPTLQRLGITDITLVTPDRKQTAFLHARALIPDSLSITYTHTRSYIAHTHEQFDLIIIAQPPPHTLGANRYYTFEFLSQLGTLLGPSGIATFSIPSSENMISDSLAAFLTTLYHTCAAAFADVAFYPGHTITALLTNRDTPLIRDGTSLISTIDHFQKQPLYFNADYLPFVITPERTAYLNTILTETPYTQNTDLMPSGFFTYLVHWSERTAPLVKRLYSTLTQHRTTVVPACLIAYCLFIVIIQKRSRAKENSAIAHAILSLGFTEISLELILILTYQSFFGYLHTAIAGLIGSYMGGLILGCMCITYLHKRRVSLSTLLIPGLSGLMALYCLGLVAYLLHHTSLHPTLQSPWWFFGIMIDIGCIGGAQFACATIMRTQTSSRVGTLYSMDMLGSACGALLTTLLLIPLFGIITTLGILVLINGIAVCWLLYFHHPIKSCFF